jgi:penicillin V acylase-like amidase (Ntn superfamily)
MKASFFSFLSCIACVSACTDFMMNFTNYKFSGRTLDLGTQSNWTVTKWSRGLSAEENGQYTARTLLNGDNKADEEMLMSKITWPSKFGVIGVSANWFGDSRYGFPIFFGDSLNEKGLSCSLLTLVDTQYEKRGEDETKENVFAGTLCQYMTQNYETVTDIANNLNNIVIYGPDALAQHFIIRDSQGLSLVIECVGGKKVTYLDNNDGKSFFGITTNEPTLDWHLKNVEHYEWKRTLARQSIAIPGNFYPEERFLRTYMVKKGMDDAGLMKETSNYQVAFALTAQVLNSVSVPQGEQYGTDSGDSSGEGQGDHTSWAVIRDHASPALYW